MADTLTGAKRALRAPDSICAILENRIEYRNDGSAFSVDRPQFRCQRFSCTIQFYGFLHADPQPVERRLELMGDVRRELPVHFDGGAEANDRVVNEHGHPIEIVSVPCPWHSHIEPALGDFLKGRLEFGNASVHPHGQGNAARQCNHRQNKRRPKGSVKKHLLDLAQVLGAGPEHQRKVADAAASDKVIIVRIYAQRLGRNLAVFRKSG